MRTQSNAILQMSMWTGSVSYDFLVGDGTAEPLIELAKERVKKKRLSLLNFSLKSRKRNSITTANSFALA